MELSKKAADRRFWAEEAKEVAHKDIKKALETKAGKKPKKVAKKGKRAIKRAKKSVKHHAMIR